MLEAALYSENLFVTLTYEDSKLPKGGTLDPRDTELWVKRFRERLRLEHGLHCRYYLVGEYGDNTWRPHYHAALFGIGIEHTKLVHDTWGKGYTQAGPLTLQSAQYIAGYVTKKMTAKEDARLQGRAPEFCTHVLGTGDWCQGYGSRRGDTEFTCWCEGDCPFGGRTDPPAERETPLPTGALPGQPPPRQPRH